MTDGWDIAGFALDVTGDLLDALEPTDVREPRIGPRAFNREAGRLLVARLLPRRIALHAREVIEGRLNEHSTDEEAEAVHTAVDLATRLALLLIQGRVIDSQHVWAEFVDRFGLEPAAEVVTDLLADTTLLPVDVFARAMYAWGAAAAATKRVPEVMQSQQPPRRPRLRPTRRPRF